MNYLHRKIFEKWKTVNLNYFWGDFFDSRFYIGHLINKEKSKITVDIGCGAGVLLHFTNSSLKIGIDSSFESILAGKKKLRTDLNLIQADARHLPLKSHFSDRIIAMHIISALSSKTDRFQSMKEIERISLNPSKILITGANRRSKHFKKIYTKEQNQSYPHYAEIVKFFQTNFNVEIEGYGPYSKVIMFPFKIIYKINSQIFDNLIFSFLKSKRFLKDGRSYIITCKTKFKK